MILLIGTPCSGKSTMGRLLSDTLQLPLITLDQFIHSAVKESQLAEGSVLTDEFIDKAVEEFFTNMIENSLNGGFIYELPYHDYVRFFDQHNIPERTLIVGFYAGYETILARNAMRKTAEQIPVKYLERCYNSIEALMGNKQSGFHFFNTGNKSAEDILKEIATQLYYD